jgi:hypothetical protein
MRLWLLAFGIATVHQTALADPIRFSGTLTISAISTGTAEKGPYQRGGETLITSDPDLAIRQGIAASYNGPTEFTATYSIVVNDDGTLDRENSTVTFTSLTFTYKGTPVADQSRFTTSPIPVYDFTLNEDKSLASFKFEGTNWYDPTGTGASAINSINMYGSIDLNAPGDTWYKAQYSSKSSGAILTYDVSGNVLYTPPGPDLPGACSNVPGCLSFLAPAAELQTPEPSSLILMLSGLASIGVAFRGRRLAFQLSQSGREITVDSTSTLRTSSDADNQ